MPRFNIARLVRTGWLLAVCGALVSPSLATPQATDARGEPISGRTQHPVSLGATRVAPVRDTVAMQPSSTVRTDADRPVVLAQASTLNVSGFFTTPSSSAAATLPIAGGLELPEPGPISAIIATLALALFFFLRRTR